MELTIALAISIIGVVISVSSFVLSRKDKAVSQEAEEQKQFSKHDLMNYRLEKIEQNIEKILNKLDFYDKEIEEKVEKAIAVHVANYHK
jgi:type II secretory pathway pseudopilin PulG